MCRYEAQADGIASETGELCDLHTHLLGMGTAEEWMNIVQKLVKDSEAKSGDYDYRFGELDAGTWAFVFDGHWHVSNLKLEAFCYHGVGEGFTDQASRLS
jgi:hypothetical protein